MPYPAAISGINANTLGGGVIWLSPISGRGSMALSTPGFPGVQSVDFESQKSTFTFTTASMALQAAPADIFQIAGAANIATRVKKVRTQVRSTVSGALNFSLVRRSTGSTGGTSAACAINRYDTTDTSGSSTGTTWTANPTATGTTVSTLINWVQPVNAAASPQQPITLIESDANMKAIVLRGASDFLVLNGNLSTLTNADNTLTFTFEITEESSLV